MRFSSGGQVEGSLAEFVSQVAADRVITPHTVVYGLVDAGKAQEDNRTGAVSGKLVLTP